MSVVSMLFFGMAELSLLSLMVCASVTGFFLIGAMIGLYTIAPALYPVGQRVTGIGWAIGIGRVGAILSPLIGGILLSYGLSSSQSMVFFAFPLLIASVVVWRIQVAKNPL
jgi:AAHS family 4-hydroxybenzoate transporter-like MFS transporter